MALKAEGVCQTGGQTGTARDGEAAGKRDPGGGSSLGSSVHWFQVTK